MKRLKTVGDLEALRRDLAAAREPDATVRVCSTGCRALGALDVCDALDAEVARRRLADRVRVVRTGCHGLCAGAVAVVIDPAGLFYQGVTPEDAAEIVEKTVLGGEVVERLCVSVDGRPVPRREDVPFFKHQRRRVLRNCGVVDPASLQDAVAHGAYAAAAEALASQDPEAVIDEVVRSGLRGRGGAGFPTGRKWQFARRAPGEEKYVICNADEGDPGAFMDRALLEGDPHLVLEGMLIGAFAIGAARGIIYVRAEYPIAIEHTLAALAQAREAGLLGHDVLGTGFAFDIDIRQGAGAFVCGEETALIASAEGRRGMPRSRPPFPATRGLHGAPTNINNVETWANVPRILADGADAFTAVGTEGSKGTKIFALAGKVFNTGLVEVPMGTTLRQIVFDIGGGIPRQRRFKAAQMGGPSGGCVPARYLDMPIDYDSVKDVGAIMGSGGLIVMDEATCMVDIARFFTDFCQKESCGKCAPCRVGTRRMLEVLERIACGEGETADLDLLEQLGEAIREASLCGLGQTAPNPVLSTLRHFRDEYEAHIRERRCPSHACEALAPVACVSACPAHVNVPEYVALTAEGRFAGALEVIRRRNPFPSVCGRACHHPCELFCRRGDVDEPVAVRHLKRFLSDTEKEVPDPPLKWRGPRRGRVAVVGSGPAGLTAAYFLALAGREVTVFEARDIVGGMLAVGIPRYRLPREVLERDIAYIRKSGVRIVTGRRVESLEELREEGFDAIFVAAGAHRGRRIGVPGENLDGVLDALTFLERVCVGELRELRGRVAVVGGGNAAIDSARAALRLGADTVTVLYRRGPEEMPATRDEIEDATLEGVQFRFLAGIQAVEGDGRVRRVRCIRMELGEADESGRQRPVPLEGSEFTVPADWVVAAVGQDPDLDFVVEDSGVLVSRGRLSVDPVTMRTDGAEVFAGGDAVTGDPVAAPDEADVFAGGDAVTGPATIVEAIAAGQRAAMAIDRFLGGKGQLPPDHGWASPGKPEQDESPEAARRRPIRQRSPHKRRENFEEVLQGYTREAACAEAQRCLRCDLEQ